MTPWWFHLTKLSCRNALRNQKILSNPSLTYRVMIGSFQSAARLKRDSDQFP